MVYKYLKYRWLVDFYRSTKISVHYFAYQNSNTYFSIITYNKKTTRQKFDFYSLYHLKEENFQKKSIKINIICFPKLLFYNDQILCKRNITKRK